MTSIAEITEIVRDECVHQGEVSAERGFDKEGLAGHFDDLLSILHRRADTGCCQDTAEAKSPSANLLDQGALRHELHLQFAGHHLPLGFCIETNMAHDSFAQ